MKMPPHDSFNDLPALPYCALYLAVVTLSVAVIPARADPETTIVTPPPLPSTTFDTITIVAEPNDFSEGSDTYTLPTTDSATGLALTDRETPQSNTVITNQQIEDQRSEDLAAIVTKTPGVAAVRVDAGRTSFLSRGFEINQYQIDGLDVDYYLGWASGEDLARTAIYDRVEVVRGATGLMTGSGQPSAFVNLIRKHANSAEPTTEISVTGNHHNNYGATVDFGTGLNTRGSVRGRFIADYQYGDTFIEREDKRYGTLYGIIDADLTDSTALSVGTQWQNNQQHNTMWGALPPYFKDGSKTDWPIDKSISADWSEWYSENLVYFGTLTQALGEQGQLEVKGSRAINTTDDRLFYLFGSALDKQTGLGLSPYPGKYEVERVQDNVQAKLTGDFEAFGQSQQAMIGLSYNSNDLQGYSFPPLSTAPISSLWIWDGSYPEPDWGERQLDTEILTKEQAVFAAAQLQVADPLTLIIGSRVSDFVQVGTDRGNDVSFQARSVWTPYAGLTFAINDYHSAYASYTEIFKPQSERDINNDLLAPIVGANYEVGLKSSNADDTLRSQFSVFRIEQDNLAQPDGDKTIPGSMPPAPAYYGAKGTVSQGIDVEVSGEITPYWQASLGYTNFEAKDQYDKTVNTRAPHTLIKAFTTYDMSATIPGLTVGAGLNFSGERYAIMTNPASGKEEKYTQEAVAIASVMARYDLTEQLSLQLNIDNLSNEKYINGIYFGQIYFGEPLTIKGKLTYQF